MSEIPERFFEAQLQGEQPPAFETMKALSDVAFEILARRPWEALDDDELVLVEGAIESAGVLPREIQVRSSDFKALLEPLSRALGISLRVSQHLSALDYAKSELLKMMGEPKPYAPSRPDDSE